MSTRSYGEGPGPGIGEELADAADAFEVGQLEDMQENGSRFGPDRIEAIAERAAPSLRGRPSADPTLTRRHAR